MTTTATASNEQDNDKPTSVASASGTAGSSVARPEAISSFVTHTREDLNDAIRARDFDRVRAAVDGGVIIDSNAISIAIFYTPTDASILRFLLRKSHVAIEFYSSVIFDAVASASDATLNALYEHMETSPLKYNQLTLVKILCRLLDSPLHDHKLSTLIYDRINFESLSQEAVGHIIMHPSPVVPRIAERLKKSECQFSITDIFKGVRRTLMVNSLNVVQNHIHIRDVMNEDVSSDPEVVNIAFRGSDSRIIRLWLDYYNNTDPANIDWLYALRRRNIVTSSKDTTTLIQDLLIYTELDFHYLNLQSDFVAWLYTYLAQHDAFNGKLAEAKKKASIATQLLDGSIDLDTVKERLRNYRSPENHYPLSLGRFTLLNGERSWGDHFEDIWTGPNSAARLIIIYLSGLFLLFAITAAVGLAVFTLGGAAVAAIIALELLIGIIFFLTTPIYTFVVGLVAPAFIWLASAVFSMKIRQGLSSTTFAIVLASSSLYFIVSLILTVMLLAGVQITFISPLLLYGFIAFGYWSPFNGFVTLLVAGLGLGILINTVGIVVNIVAAVAETILNVILDFIISPIASVIKYYFMTPTQASVDKLIDALEPRLHMNVLYPEAEADINSHTDINISQLKTRKAELEAELANLRTAPATATPSHDANSDTDSLDGEHNTGAQPANSNAGSLDSENNTGAQHPDHVVIDIPQNAGTHSSV